MFKTFIVKITDFTPYDYSAGHSQTQGYLLSFEKTEELDNKINVFAKENNLKVGSFQYQAISMEFDVPNSIRKNTINYLIAGVNFI